jgi:hypothetical protein
MSDFRCIFLIRNILDRKPVDHIPVENILAMIETVEEW